MIRLHLATTCLINYCPVHAVSSMDKYSHLKELHVLFFCQSMLKSLDIGMILSYSERCSLAWMIQRCPLRIFILLHGVKIQDNELNA